MIHPAEVELSKDAEYLIFRAKDNPDCQRLWGQLAGQLLNATEGRQKIYYNMPEDLPDGATLEIEGDPDQLILLLGFLENQVYGKFIPAGTTAKIQKQIEATEKASAAHESGDAHDSLDDDRKFSPK
jgi:hypothetical protein